MTSSFVMYAVLPGATVIFYLMARQEPVPLNVPGGSTEGRRMNQIDKYFVRQMKHRWSLDKPMASLSTLPLGCFALDENLVKNL